MHTHKNLGRGLLACSVATCAIVTAGQAFAADAAPADAAPTTVQEVVVTANKRAEKLHDVAMGVTALGGDKLDTQQAVSFVDYAAQVPSLALQAIGPGESRLTLRGENSGGVGSTTAVYIDESPFGSSNALANGSITTGDFDTFDLQRVEVLRGPQGTLYGASTEGGLIKFVLNAPDPTRYSVAAETGVQSVEHGQTAADVKAMVNLPLLGGQAALRLGGYDEALPGYVNDPLLGRRDVNAGRKYGLRASFLYQPNDQFSVKLTAVSQLTKTGGPNAVDVVGAPLAGGACPPSGTMPAGCFAPPANQLSITNGLTRNTFFPESFEDRIENFSGELVWNPGPVSVTSITSYGILNLSFDEDATALEAAPGLSYGSYFSNLIYGGVQTPDIAQLTGLHKYTEELRIASRSGGQFEWQVGGFFTRENTVIQQTINTTSTNGLPPPGGDLITAKYQEWAGFADATYHFTPQFDVEAGLRWSTNSQSAQTIDYYGLLTTGGGPTTVPAPYTSSGSDFTYSIAPRWHVTPDTLVYARVATGYRPGGPNDLPAGATGAPRAYSSDATLNYEVGLRSSLFDHRLSIDVAAFHVDWTNMQIFEELVVNGTPTGVNNNAGNAKSQGVEWTIGLFPVQGFTLSWTGSYTDAKLTSLSPQATILAQSGDRLPYVPTWQTSLDGEYKWALTANYDGFVGATWSYIGSRHSDYNTYQYLPSVLPPYGDLSPGDGYVKLPSYDTFAIRAGVENDRWRFEIYGKNLGDARGITSYSSSGATYMTSGGLEPGGTISIIQPRTFGAELSVKY
ncbi:MAG TPA: TonB-dependent receptor [Caulobacteraceae bacterium]|jgi:outer membrane receptor protein involved in Fe transport|nr:TonB-dependent receptor [Caulobacteraceae bacterium]